MGDLVCFLIRLFYKNIERVKYFSPDGRTMPNSICYHRGAFLFECRKNMDSFHLELEKCNNVGIVVFISEFELNATQRQMIDSKLRNRHKWGRAFYGKYKWKNEELYDKKSTTLEVCDISLYSLIKLSLYISKITGSALLVDDLSKGKFYINSHSRRV